MTRAKGCDCARLSHCYTPKAENSTCTLFVLNSLDIILSFVWHYNSAQLQSPVNSMSQCFCYRRGNTQIPAPSRRVCDRTLVVGRRRTLLKGGLDVSGRYGSGVKAVKKVSDGDTVVSPSFGCFY